MDTTYSIMPQKQANVDYVSGDNRTRPARRGSLSSFMFGNVIGFFFAMIFLVTIWPVPMNRNINNEIILNHDVLGLSLPKNKNMNVTVANKLSNEVQILCIITTSGNKHHTRGRHIYNTWGRKCNRIVRINTIRRNWMRAKAILNYIYRKDYLTADWFLMVDDETFVIMENLRYLLQSYSSDAPIFFSSNWQDEHIFTGAAYVFSDAALRLLAEKDYQMTGRLYVFDEKKWKSYLHMIGIKSGDSIDAYGLGTFFPFTPAYHLTSKYQTQSIRWFGLRFYKDLDIFKCCSDHAITFHHISPRQMYALEYLIYNLHPYGIVKNDNEDHSLTINQTGIIF